MASKWNIYDSQIKDLLHQNSEQGFTNIAKSVLPPDPTPLDIKLIETYIRRNKSRLLDLNEGIYDACAEINVDFTSAKHLWIKTKDKSGGGVSGFIKNPNYIAPEEEEEKLKEIDFLSIFKDKVIPVIVPKPIEKNESLFDRLVYTDVHIGMDPNEDGYSLYGGKWDEEEINRRLDIMIDWTLKNQKSNILHIQDLADFLDGYNAMTTRGGHDLPQCMDNQTMFDVGLLFKIKLIDSLIPYFDKIISYNVCEDNHAGSFGYTVNSAYKTYIELKYPNRVEVTNQRKFIDFYHATPKHCFILTHGKDSKSLKFGFKPVLDKNQENKIDNYIKEYFLLQKGIKIEFGKGDSHQYVFDNSTSRSFQYQNFPAFSPPSNWVQTNFQNSMSGFVHFNYYENGQKTVNDYIF